METAVYGDIWPSAQSHAYGWSQISQKRLEIFLTILCLLLEENISIHINLVSQLDALVGEAGIPRNID